MRHFTIKLIGGPLHGRVKGHDFDGSLPPQYLEFVDYESISEPDLEKNGLDVCNAVVLKLTYILRGIDKRGWWLYDYEVEQ